MFNRDPRIVILMEAAQRGRELRRQREAQQTARSAVILADNTDRTDDSGTQKAAPANSGSLPHAD